ncbi:putative peptidase M41 [Helianthus annuus]|nr:putative peptidase M41 [Helianthus annuus]KAJ0582469.1 putative peptidase M41 [Helianthus annuus]KAJ0729710.1 putative peptidase M41 [Helianthus annuus]KAJ0909351.1 putative peptidase M41 [Helianthus annuus]
MKVTHALVAICTDRAHFVHKATIVPRGMAPAWWLRCLKKMKQVYPEKKCLLGSMYVWVLELHKS